MKGGGGGGVKQAHFLSCCDLPFLVFMNCDVLKNCSVNSELPKASMNYCVHMH